MTLQACDRKLGKPKKKAIYYLLNPSRDARMISPGKRPKNFFPAFEFATEPVMNPETLTTPERTPVATFSVICVTLLTLYTETAIEKSAQAHKLFVQ